MAELLKLVTGDLVEITYGNKIIYGRVILSSQNHVSLMLRFNSALWGPDGIFVGMMAVLWMEEKKEYEDIIQHQAVSLKKKDRHDLRRPFC